jgi:MFS family permease
MTEPVPAQLGRARSLAAVIIAMAMVTMNHGLSYPLLALVLERHGISSSLIGISTAVQAFAGLVFAFFAGNLIGRYGPGPIMAVSLATIAALYLLLGAFPDYLLWLPLRFLLGGLGSFLWVASEAWINALTDNASRGRVIGIYSTAAAVGSALGPGILLLTGSQGFAPFIVIASVSFAGSICILLAGTVRPAFPGTPSGGVLRYLLLAPLPILLNFAYASIMEAFHTFFPIYAKGLAYLESDAFFIMTLIGLGGILLQYPMGWLADHMNRLLLLLICLGASLAGILCIPLMLGAGVVGYALFFLFGGIMSSLYSFGVVLLGERFRGADLAMASAMFTMMWSGGTFVGPPVAGFLMDQLGPSGLIVAMAGAILVFLPMPIRALFRSARAA